MLDRGVGQASRGMFREIHLNRRNAERKIKRDKIITYLTKITCLIYIENYHEVFPSRIVHSSITHGEPYSKLCQQSISISISISTSTKVIPRPPPPHTRSRSPQAAQNVYYFFSTSVMSSTYIPTITSQRLQGFLLLELGHQRLALFNSYLISKSH